MKTKATIAAMAIVGIAGSAFADTGVDFRTAKWLSARSVLNGSGENIATASDMIVDRGEGRVTHLIVTTGTILGMGGRDVAIPFGAFAWSPDMESLVLNSTTDELKTFPEFSASTWTQMMESESSESDLRRSLATDSGVAGDPYATSLKDGETVRIEGTVMSVERKRSADFGEQTILTVDTGAAAAQSVALGPSWYVGGGAYVPMRGDEVVINARQLPRDPNRTAVATDLKKGDHQLRFRDDKGSPVWNVKSVPSGDRKYNAPYWQYMLASSLRGADVNCRGEDCGDVENVIVERRSGDIAFLSIDPDTAFLGIGDTSRLIPWSVVSVAHNGEVRIDASKEMVVASQPSPSDLKNLSSATTDSVYSAYAVRAPRFEPVKPRTPRGMIAGDAWSTRGAIISGIDKDSVRTISGKVRRASEVTFDEDIAPARSVVIESSNGDEVVLLGPSWFMSKQAINCEPGDTITAEVCRTRINGKSYWIARSLQVEGERVELLDSSNRPTWDRK